MKLITLLAILFALVVAPSASAQTQSDWAEWAQQPRVFKLDFDKQDANMAYLPLTVKALSNQPKVYFSLRYQSGVPIRPLRASVRQVAADRWMHSITIRSVPELDTIYRICWRFARADDGCPDDWSLEGNWNWQTFIPQKPDIRPNLKFHRQGAMVVAQADAVVKSYRPVRFRTRLLIQQFVSGTWHTEGQVKKVSYSIDTGVTLQEMRPLRLSLRAKPGRYRAVFRYSVETKQGGLIAGGKVDRLLR